jgi:hypothetical protein
MVAKFLLHVKNEYSYTHEIHDFLKRMKLYRVSECSLYNAIIYKKWNICQVFVIFVFDIAYRNNLLFSFRGRYTTNI